MKPFLTLTAKHWLSGRSTGSYAGVGGILFSANGVSAVRNITSTSENNVGLLQAGPSGTAGGSSVIVDTPIAGVRNSDPDGTNSYLYVLGSSGHVYKKDQLGGAPTDLGASNQITTPACGLAAFQPAGGTKYLYYFQTTQIGRVSLAAAPGNRPTGWTDNWQTGLQSTVKHPTHAFLDGIYYGNDYYIGSIRDNGAADVTHNDKALDVPQIFRVLALEDDGFYLVASLTADKQSIATNVQNKIIFWDTVSSSWNKEFPVQDPIVALKRIGNVIYGLGTRGIYTISYTDGVKKVWLIGANSVLTSSVYGPWMLSSVNESLVIAGVDTVSLFGKPTPTLPFTYHTPITIDSANTTVVTFVDGEFSHGTIFIGDSTPQFKEYGLGVNLSSHRTGVSATTVNFPLEERIRVDRVDVILGRALVAGDSLSVGISNDNGVTTRTYGVVSYATHGAVRRVIIRPAAYNTAPLECDDLKLTLTFTAGSPAVRTVKFYGTPVDPQQPV